MISTSEHNNKENVQPPPAKKPRRETGEEEDDGDETSQNNANNGKWNPGYVMHKLNKLHDDVQMLSGIVANNITAQQQIKGFMKFRPKTNEPTNRVERVSEQARAQASI